MLFTKYYYRKLVLNIQIFIIKYIRLPYKYMKRILYGWLRERYR